MLPLTKFSGADIVSSGHLSKSIHDGIIHNLGNCSGGEDPHRSNRAVVDHD